MVRTPFFLQTETQRPNVAVAIQAFLRPTDRKLVGSSTVQTSVNLVGGPDTMISSERLGAARTISARHTRRLRLGSCPQFKGNHSPRSLPFIAIRARGAGPPGIAHVELSDACVADGGR